MGRDSVLEVCGALSVVSIHAPAWGATSIGRRFALACQSFNPRARMGRDLIGFQAVR